MIKVIDSENEYAADDNIKRAATLIADSGICQQGYKTADTTAACGQNNHSLGSYMGVTAGGFFVLSQYCDSLHLRVILCKMFIPQKMCNREYP